MCQLTTSLFVGLIQAVRVAIAAVVERNTLLAGQTLEMLGFAIERLGERNRNSE
jgi:hypothetical protein